MNLTLFYNVSAKYQSILPINASRHIEMCEHPIDLVFIVYADKVDHSVLIDNLRSEIGNKIEINAIHEQQAADIIGLNDTTDSCVRDDGYMLMIASKLHADLITKRDNIIITDPDNLLLKPTRYIEDDKAILYHSNPFTATFDRIGKEIFGSNVDFSYDFMTEKLLVQKKILEPMRAFMKDAIKRYSYKRHTWYDISQDEYDVLAGPDWPTRFDAWDELPAFVQQEIMQMVEPMLIKTQWFEEFADYMMYGYYAMLHHPDKVILRETKIQNGPWGDGSADIFLNRPSKGNSIDAFRYMCNINKAHIE